MGLGNGDFVWFDLATPDPRAAIDWYGRLLGWTTQADDPNGQYTMWKTADGPFGGVMELTAEAKAMGAPPNWMGYVQVEDAVACADRARELGGQVIVAPREVGEGIQFAVLRDPQGAVFAVYRGAGSGDAKLPVAWCELYTSDIEAACAFYGALFGWSKADAMDMGPMGTYQLVRNTSVESFAGFMRSPLEMPGSAWCYYFYTPSCDATTARAQEMGAQLVNGPMDVPGGGRISQLVDPQGAMFAIFAMAGT